MPVSANNLKTTRTRGRWLLPVTLVALCMLLLAVLASPMFTGEVYIGDDLGAFHLPLRAFYAEQLQAEQSFDWWPQLFGGYYATGEGQLGGYHPLHLALYKYLPLETAFNLEVFLSYPLMLLGMFCWLRRILGRALPALFGAVVFTFSGFNLLHLFHVNAIAVVAHIPCLLLAIDVVLKTDERRAAAWAWLAVAMLTGSQLLLGYPQYVWFSLLVEIGYVGWVITTQRKSRRAGGQTATPRQLLQLASAKAVGLLLGSLQLLPTFDALQHSVRQSAAAGFAESYSLHPLNFVQLVAPYLFENRVVGQNTHALGLYAGAVPLLLLVYLVGQRKHLGRLRPIAIAAACLGAFALLMALGRFGFLYRLQGWLPIVGSFRAPCRMIVLFHLSTAVLSAVALMHLVRRQRQTRPPGDSPKTYLLMFALSLAALPLAMIFWSEHLASWPRMLLGPALVGIAAALVYLSARRSSWALAGLLVFCAADLGVYGLSYSLWEKTANLEEQIASLAKPAAATSPDTAHNQSPARVALHLPAADSAERVGNLITLAGYLRVHGYVGLEPARRLDYRDPRALRLAGAGWIHHEFDEGSVRSPRERNQRETTNDEFVLPTWKPLDRFRLVTRAHVSDDPAGDLEYLDAETTALVEIPLQLTAATPGRLTPIFDDAGQMALEVEVPTQQLLITNEAYHHGWRLWIDGQLSPALRVNGDFLGAVVPAGRHTIGLQFMPRSLRNGRFVSGCGLGLLGLGFLLIRFRRRRTEPMTRE